MYRLSVQNPSGNVQTRSNGLICLVSVVVVLFMGWSSWWRDIGLINERV